ncbi:MAG: ubiquinol-cytochrome c reductase iron-sulfur subunit [Candidatus Tectomicrobia bacterium]|nr:ubiquinol-cytochrome c reductase iron-sulfur subunit [Candidatus Tectomicrobia bacterium]
MLTRRTFLDRLRHWLLGILGLSGLAGVAGYLYPPALRRRGEPLLLANAAELKAGEGRLFDYYGEPAILLHGQEAPRALSLVCTHLGCSVRWQPKEGRFVCPCHRGIFDADGNVLAGPPPAPLERLRVQVQGNHLLVG